MKAPHARVWRALTDHREFSEWSGVNLESPFLPGQTTAGQITIPSFEHVRMEVVVQAMEPEHYFSYTWHPYAVEPEFDYSAEEPTLVEFHLEEIEGGTRLIVSESGFAKIPAARRAEAFRMNDRGWAAQLESIEEHVAK